MHDVLIVCVCVPCIGVAAAVPSEHDEDLCIMHSQRAAAVALLQQSCLLFEEDPAATHVIGRVSLAPFRRQATPGSRWSDENIAELWVDLYAFHLGTAPKGMQSPPASHTPLLNRPDMALYNNRRERSQRDPKCMFLWNELFPLRRVHYGGCGRPANGEVRACAHAHGSLHHAQVEDARQRAATLISPDVLRVVTRPNLTLADGGGEPAFFFVPRLPAPHLERFYGAEALHVAKVSGWRGMRCALVRV